eukprot:265991_1
MIYLKSGASKSLKFIFLMMFSWWLLEANKFTQLKNIWTLQTDDSMKFTATVCCIATSALFIMFYAPFLSYHFCRYYQQRNHIVFRKRRNNITHWEVSIFLFKLFYGAIMYNSYLLWDTTSLTFNIFLCIDDWLLMIILYLWVWRFYILLYDINWTCNVLNNEWKVLLNSSSTQQNWYLMNRKTYGSARWIFFRFTFPAIFCSCLLLTANVILGQLVWFKENKNEFWGFIQLWGAFIEIIPFFILIIIFCKSNVSQFEDQFFILKELKYIFIALAIDNLANVLTFIGQSFLWSNDMFEEIIIPTFAYNIIWGSQWIACLISTFWVNSQVHSIVKYNQYQIVRKRLSFGFDESVSSVQFLQIARPNHLLNINNNLSSTSTSGQYTSNKNNELFFKLLSKPQGFLAFMLHLSQEFSCEVLLFLIEVIQFQNYVKAHCKYDLLSDIPRSSLYEKISFPSDVPLSEIVYSDQKKQYDNENALLQSLKIKAVKIFNKYILPQSALAINISYHGRRQLTKLMGNQQIVNKWLADNTNPTLQFKELLDLYEEACNQLFALIIDSFNRFKHTPSYQQLKEFKAF